LNLYENPLVKKFIEAFAYTGYLDWYKDEVQKDDVILISCPSNICGIVYTDKLVKKCKHDSGWGNYNYNGFRPSKKNANYVLFEGHFYSCDYILKVFNKFFKNKDSFDIRRCSVPKNDYYGMFIKIDSTFSIGVANVLYTAIREENGGVVFVDTKWIGEGENLKEVEIDKHCIEWNKGKATYVDYAFGKPWTRVVYNQDYLFNKQEEIGDSLLI